MKYDEAVQLAERTRERIRRHEDQAIQFEAEGGSRAMGLATIMRDCAAVASIALMRAEARLCMGHMAEDEPEAVSAPQGDFPRRRERPDQKLPPAQSPLRGVRRSAGR